MGKMCHYQIGSNRRHCKDKYKYKKIINFDFPSTKGKEN